MQPPSSGDRGVVAGTLYCCHGVVVFPSGASHCPVCPPETAEDRALRFGRHFKTTQAVGSHVNSNKHKKHMAGLQDRFRWNPEDWGFCMPIGDEEAWCYVCNQQVPLTEVRQHLQHSRTEEQCHWKLSEASEISNSGVSGSTPNPQGFPSELFHSGPERGLVQSYPQAGDVGYQLPHLECQGGSLFYWLSPLDQLVRTNCSSLLMVISKNKRSIARLANLSSHKLYFKYCYSASDLEELGVSDRDPGVSVALYPDPIFQAEVKFLWQGSSESAAPRAKRIREERHGEAPRLMGDLESLDGTWIQKGDTSLPWIKIEYEPKSASRKKLHLSQLGENNKSPEADALNVPTLVEGTRLYLALGDTDQAYRDAELICISSSGSTKIASYRDLVNTLLLDLTYEDDNEEQLILESKGNTVWRWKYRVSRLISAGSSSDPVSVLQPKSVPTADEEEAKDVSSSHKDTLKEAPQRSITADQKAPLEPEPEAKEDTQSEQSSMKDRSEELAAIQSQQLQQNRVASAPPGATANIGTVTLQPGEWHIAKVMCE